MLRSKSTFSDLLIKWLLTFHCMSNEMLDMYCCGTYYFANSMFDHLDLFCEDLTVGSFLVFTNIYV